MLAIAALWWTWHTRLIFSIIRTLAPAGIRGGGENVRRESLPYPISRAPAQLRFRHLGQDLARLRLRHPGRRGSVLSRPRRAAADARSRDDGSERRRFPARALVGVDYFLARPSCSSRSASICSATACATSTTSRASDERRAAARRSSRSQRRLWTDGRVAHILRDVSLDVPARRHVALGRRSGCGKSVTMRAIMGLLTTPPASIRGGEIRFDGRDLLRLSGRECEALRGTAMSMVFQDPTTSLNPVFTIGDQMGSILKYADRRLKRSRNRRSAWRASQRCWARSAWPIPNESPSLSDHAFGRHAPAHSDRHGAPLRAAAAHRRRAGHSARRHDPGANPEAPARSRRGARPRASDDHPQSRRRARGGGPSSSSCMRVASSNSGPTHAVFAQPSHPYTRALLPAFPNCRAADDLRGIDGSLPDYSAPPPGCRFEPRCPLAVSACLNAPPHFEVAPGQSAACWRLEATA